jgi:group I intron endonuclease
MENALKRSRSHIYSALLKNGHSNFSLTIIEYCFPEKCLEREDFVLSSLQHEYNILEKAGSRLGHIISDETRQKMSDANKGKNHPNYGKTISEETRKKISDTIKAKPRPEGSGRPSQLIEVFDLEEKTSTSYNSISEAARVLDINQVRIFMYFARNQQKPYKGRYIFKKAD